MRQEYDEDTLKKADWLARHVLSLSRDSLFLNLRFLDSAVSRLVPTPYEGSIGTDTSHLFFDCFYIMKLFQENSLRITRIYLHTVLHCVFQHPYVGDVVRYDVWDLACDIAVEQMLRELQLGCVDDSCEADQDNILRMLQQKVGLMTAEKIYRYFSDMHISEYECEQLRELFRMDDHEPWYVPAGSGYGNSNGDDENQQGYGGGSSGNNPDDGEGDGDGDGDGSGGYGGGAMSPEEARETWERLSRQIQVDLETFSKGRGSQAGYMMQNLQALHRERYDYSEFLRKFAVYGEAMRIDDDSFDYNFYTYGMRLYGNMPLIEPLEYKDIRAIKEFVVAIDTSGSVAGDTVQKFLQKTYNILKQQESFFTKVNIHIIQCDAAIQEDAKITNQQEFDEYIQNMKIRGLGGTDFRPVFAYVDQLIQKKEFTDLRGLIYFTDGQGTFPERMPHYKAAFVFLEENGFNNYNVPVWAMKLVLEPSDIIDDK